MTVINSERHLRCLFLKPTLRFATMSSSPSSSQMIQGMTGSTSVSSSVPTKDESNVESSSVLATKEDAKEAEAEGDASDI